MDSSEKPLEEGSSSEEGWKERILFPTLLAGIVGGGAGLVSKHRKVHGLANISATYAANFAIVSGCYCGAREFVRMSRTSAPDDLLNSAIGGFGCGAILGRLQGGRAGAVRYSVMFAFAMMMAAFVALVEGLINLNSPLSNIQLRSSPKTLWLEEITLLMVVESALLLEKHQQFLWQAYQKEDPSGRLYMK